MACAMFNMFNNGCDRLINDDDDDDDNDDADDNDDDDDDDDKCTILHKIII